MFGGRGTTKISGEITGAVTQQASQSHARQRRSMQRAIKILLASDGGLNNEPTQKHIEEKEPLTCQEGEGEEEYDALLLALPKELLIEIFCFCSIKDVCKAREVSRTWRNLIERDALLWRRLGRRDLALPDIEEFMSPQERASMREGQEPINWVDIYRRAFGGWDGSSPLLIFKGGQPSPRVCHCHVEKGRPLGVVSR